MPKLKPGTIIPTKEEDAAITAAAMSDPDNPVYSDAEWEKVKPAVRKGRPIASSTKTRITIRLSPEVVEKFKDSGAGWQTRIDEVLSEWLKTHTPVRKKRSKKAA